MLTLGAGGWACGDACMSTSQSHRSAYQWMQATFYWVHAETLRLPHIKLRGVMGSEPRSEVGHGGVPATARYWEAPSQWPGAAPSAASSAQRCRSAQAARPACPVLHWMACWCEGGTRGVGLSMLPWSRSAPAIPCTFEHDMSCTPLTSAPVLQGFAWSPHTVFQCSSVHRCSHRKEHLCSESRRSSLQWLHQCAPT